MHPVYFESWVEFFKRELISVIQHPGVLVPAHIVLGVVYERFMQAAKEKRIAPCDYTPQEWIDHFVPFIHTDGDVFLLRDPKDNWMVGFVQPIRRTPPPNRKDLKAGRPKRTYKHSKDDYLPHARATCGQGWAPTDYKLHINRPVEHDPLGEEVVAEALEGPWRRPLGREQHCFQ